MITFKFPGNIDVSYVMRLVGLPGEKIVVYDGDVFANDRRLEKPPARAEELWIPVSDTEHGVTAAWQPVRAGNGWRQEGRAWRFSHGGRAEGVLECRQEVTDRSIYNWYAGRVTDSGLPVGEVRVTCTLGACRGEGYLGLWWSRGEAEARLLVGTGGSVRLECACGVEERDLGSGLEGTQEVSFGIRDGRFFVARDRDRPVVFARAVLPAELPEAEKGAGRASGPCRVSLIASCCELALSRITVERDVYYRTPPAPMGRGTPEKPMVLGADEFFVLGDNSVISADSRMWHSVDARVGGTCQPGAVPAHLIEGVIRAIVWPPSRWRFFPSAEETE
jgi:hypothetical protein